MATYDYTVEFKLITKKTPEVIEYRYVTRNLTKSFKNIRAISAFKPFSNETKMRIARQLKRELLAEYQQRLGVGRLHQSHIKVVERARTNMREVPMRQSSLNYIDLDGSDTNQGTCVIDKLETYLPREHLIKHFTNYKSGITIEQIEKFCKKYDISMYACDLFYNKIATFKSKNRNYPAFIFVLANGHIYEVTNKKLRNDITKGANIMKPKRAGKSKTNPLNELSEELSKPFYKEDYTLDDINEDFEKIPSGDWYLPGVSYNLERLFFYIVKVDKVIPPCRYNGNTMIMVNWPRKYATIYYNENLKEVQALTSELGIPFANQSLGQLVLSITGDFKEHWSTYNNETLQMVKTLQAKPLVKDLVNTYEGDILAIDIKRCYYSVLKKLPKIDITNEVEIYTDQKLTNCYCYVNTTDDTLYHGPGWYPSHYLKVLPQPVTHILKYKTTELDFSSANVYASNKIIINTAIGLLGKKETKVTKPVFTTSPEEAGYYCWLSNLPCTILQNSETTLYKVVAKQKKTSTLGGRLMYCYIVQMGRLACYNLMKKMEKIPTFIPIRVRTDCVIGTISKNIKVKQHITIRDKNPGDYRIVDVTMTKLRPETYTHDNSVGYTYHREPNKTIVVNEQWDPETYPKTLLDIDSFVCMAPAGSGKTMLLNKMYEHTEKAVVLAYTGVACSMLHSSKAQTLHSFFKIPADKPFIVDPDQLRFLAEKTKVIFVDEISMLGIAHFTALLQLKQLKPSIKFYLFGDYRQLPPVKDIQIGLSSNAMRDLANTTLNLNYNFRNGEFAKQLANKTFNIKTCRKWEKYDLCNITHTNRLANKINNIIAKKQPKLGELGSYIRFRKRQGEIPKNFLARVEQLTPEVKLKQLYGNDRVFTLTPEEFDSMKEHIYLAYAFTNYCAQSLTIPIDYTIWEWEHPFFNDNAKYTALSRCKKPEQLCIRMAGI